MTRKSIDTENAREELEIPVHMSQDHETNDDDDYIDRMAMDSFPASDPPSFSPTTMGTPVRGKAREPQRDRSTGRSATGVAVLRSVGSIFESSARLIRANVRSIVARFFGRPQAGT